MVYRSPGQGDDAQQRYVAILHLQPPVPLIHRLRQQLLPILSRAPRAYACTVLPAEAEGRSSGYLHGGERYVADDAFQAHVAAGVLAFGTDVAVGEYPRGSVGHAGDVQLVRRVTIAGLSYDVPP